MNNKVKLSFRVAWRIVIFSCALIVIWFFGAKDSVSFEKFVLLVGPYLVAWAVLSILSVAISGMIFKPFWMGSFSDRDVYTFPNIIYVVVFVVIILTIYIVQYANGVI